MIVEVHGMDFWTRVRLPPGPVTGKRREIAVSFVFNGCGGFSLFGWNCDFFLPIGILAYAVSDCKIHFLLFFLKFSGGGDIWDCHKVTRVLKYR